MRLNEALGALLASAIISSCVLPEQGGSSISIAGAAPYGGTTSQPIIANASSNQGGMQNQGAAQFGGSGSGDTGGSGGACIGATSSIDGGCNCGTGGTLNTQCPTGMADCDNNGTCETDLTTDPNHCGSCATSCQYLVCHNSTCALPGLAGSDGATDLTDAGLQFAIYSGVLLGLQIQLIEGDLVVAFGAITTMFDLHDYSTFEVALYDEVNGRPYNLLQATGNFGTTNGVSEEVINPPFEIPASGNYWVMILNTGSVALKLIIDNPGMSPDVVYGQGYSYWPTDSSGGKAFSPIHRLRRI